MTQTDVDCDVLVVGGGPAGSTAATLLARQGRRVLLLEKQRHPRFHIGESLLPANLPILEQLGVLDRVRAIGVCKLGADFPSGDGGYRTFRFTSVLGNTPPSAFQVRRSEFDELLFAHARDNGVDAREGVEVEQVEVAGIGQVKALARAADGQPLRIAARYLVDASGRDTLLGSALKLKRRNRRHQTAAIFAHFRGVERRPGEDAGNISICTFEHGWCWLIPLRDDIVSVGCVCRPEHLKQRRGRNEAFLLDTLRRIPAAWSRMSRAEQVGDVQVTGNYAYACSAMAGPGWVMAGDAYAFVDPVFSSGVYLAMDGGQRAAAMVGAALDSPRRERRLQRAFASRVRRGLKVFSWFIYRFDSPVMRQLFAQPGNRWRLFDGVISMLAGDVFDNAAVRRRLHLIKGVYALLGAWNWRRHRADLAERRRQARIEFGADAPPDRS